MILSTMDEQKVKLDKLKQEQKLKSKKEKLLNSYIGSSQNLEDKIAVVKLKHRIDKSSFVLSLKHLMNNK